MWKEKCVTDLVRLPSMLSHKIIRILRDGNNWLNNSVSFCIVQTYEVEYYSKYTSQGVYFSMLSQLSEPENKLKCIKLSVTGM